jgi:CheY-like chemotaxis protein
MAEGRINLKAATVLVVDPNAQGLSILASTMSGFGVRTIHKAETYEEAQTLASTKYLDLVICEATFSADELDGYGFIHWLRHSGMEPNAYVPAIVTSPHTSKRAVARARDCGAHYLVAKPLVPGVLLDRILWVAQDTRPYVNCETYMGPDRRFRNDGPPPGSDGRRSTDLTAALGEAKMPNMSQDDIDGLMLPKRVAL